MEGSRNLIRATIDLSVQMKLRPPGRTHPDRGVSKFPLPNPETCRRLFRFLAVGGGTALVQLGVLWVLQPHLAETLAFSFSWVVSTATHYLANRFWALPSARHDQGKQFGEYLLTIAVSFIINLVAFRFCRDALGLGLMWATLWAIPPSTVVVFLMLNYRVFRPKKP